MMAEPSGHTPFARLAGGYWVESRRPLTSLVFLAPLLITYEAGVLVLRVQNGADAWMRNLLDLMGFGQHFVLPLVTVCCLLSWHYLTRQPWRVSSGTLSAMAVECILLAAVLWLLLQLQGSLFQAIAGPVELSLATKVKDAVGFLGAGIYEELLFRLILLSAMAWAIRRLGTAPAKSMLAAALLSSLLFSAAHHVGPYGDPFGWFTFLFRFLAGVFFSILFVYRGFGIAAGTHAAYDILLDLFRC
jgi:membrane protease YdiL (CAAX protease family)